MSTTIQTIYEGDFMRTSAFFLTAILLIICSATVQARIIHVPGDSSTIQGGINGAANSDTVMVADGTYTGDGNRDIDFTGKAIVVMSENGPDNCIIDCEGSEADPHRGFYFQSGENETSLLKGFTIKHGFIDGSGGGIYCINSSSPSIRDNIIMENQSWGGGGIKCDDSSPVVEKNIILRNIGSSSGGGISIYGSKSHPIVVGNIIRENGGDWAGGIFIDRTTYTIIKGNEITLNEAYEGGGIMSYSSNPVIMNNKIIGNVAYNSGGGVRCTMYSSPFLVDNIIVGNIAEGFYGGAGGGIWCEENSFVRIEGTTITENIADEYGGGIYCDDSFMHITNSIVLENSAGIAGENIYAIDSNRVEINYSNIEGGWEGDGNIDANPMFVLPDKHDYRLLWGSPCIDSGISYFHDPDGTRSDMGAYYFNQDDYLTLYLTPNMTEVVQGGQLEVIYTVINRWSQPESFWGLTQAILPGGNPLNVLGPDQFTLPANTTIQRHFNHDIPTGVPLGLYEYWSQIGLPSSTIYDEDRFMFTVTN
jgi:parallel beta-helix repeat protein/predicted outer membrane repeat protein